MQMHARNAVQTKAQPMLGLFVGVFLALLGTSFAASSAWAQFDKTTWPTKVATPAMDAVDLQGKAWTATELAGKVVVLNFWATWCAPIVLLVHKRWRFIASPKPWSPINRGLKM